MGKQQLYWLGPGNYGYGKTALKPGDPLPDNFSKENLRRFKNKIGEKIERGVIGDVKTLKDEIKKLKTEVKVLQEEKKELLEQLESLDKEREEEENE